MRTFFIIKGKSLYDSFLAYLIISLAIVFGVALGVSLIHQLSVDIFEYKLFTLFLGFGPTFMLIFIVLIIGFTVLDITFELLKYYREGLSDES